MMSAMPRMFLTAVVLVVMVIGVTRVYAASKLPSNFKRCAVSDPKLSECLRLAVEDAFLKMKDGVSSLGVLPVDPLKVDRIKIDQGTGSVSINMELRNISISGLSHTKMTNYSANLEDGELLTESLTSWLRLEFDYVASGRILLIPLRGAGPGTISMTNLLTDHYLKFIPKTKKDGRMYWNMQEYRAKFNPKAISMDLKGLFGGDGRLGDQINAVLNQNARLIFDEIGGAFEDAFSAVFKDITTRVFNKVPFNDIFVSSN